MHMVGLETANNAFENGRSQARLRALARAVQRGRSAAEIDATHKGIVVEQKKSRAIQSFVVFIACLWLVVARGETATVSVNCDAGGTMSGALSSLKPGDVVAVNGTCSENVLIQPEVQRITLDGQGKATINGPSATQPTVLVIGREVTIKGFTITGGQFGISVNRGGTVVIDRNTIHSTGNDAIVVAQNAFAHIVNNTIRDNPRFGIVVLGSSSARIGFVTDLDPAPSPNTIQHNGDGIAVIRSSNAHIVGNTISGNKRNGVMVLHASHAALAGNTLNENGQHGIRVVGNSGVNLGADTGTRMVDLPNATTTNNGGFGIRCEVGGFADGRLGSLNGGSGAKDFADTGCIDSLSP